MTPAQNAIETADAHLSNAVLPTYSELLAALQALLDHEDEREVNGIGLEFDSSALADAKKDASALIDRHDRTMRGDFGA